MRDNYEEMKRNFTEWYVMYGAHPAFAAFKAVSRAQDMLAHDRKIENRLRAEGKIK